MDERIIKILDQLIIENAIRQMSYYRWLRYEEIKQCNTVTLELFDGRIVEIDVYVKEVKEDIDIG